MGSVLFFETLKFKVNLEIRVAQLVWNRVTTETQHDAHNTIQLENKYFQIQWNLYIFLPPT